LFLFWRTGLLELAVLRCRPTPPLVEVVVGEEPGVRIGYWELVPDVKGIIIVTLSKRTVGIDFCVWLPIV
jgi:hypothetical protein